MMMMVSMCSLYYACDNDDAYVDKMRMMHMVMMVSMWSLWYACDNDDMHVIMMICM